MSGMQAALLIRREKQRLRGGKAVNFRELPSNLATRLIPPLPRYPPRSYVYGCGGQGPGKAAWQGCARPSPFPLSPISPHGRGVGTKYSDKSRQREAYCRWKQKNKIRDASYCYGGSSGGENDEEDGRRDDDEEEDESSGADHPRGEVSAAVNTVLYAGLGTTALGLVISFVGTGEKGFLSPELRLVGPSLLCAGLLCCLFRVLLCLCLCRRCTECQEKSAKKYKSGEHSRNNTRSLPTASLLPPTTIPSTSAPSASANVRATTFAATTATSSSTVTKAHELLLSPAQLPE